MLRPKGRKERQLKLFSREYETNESRRGLLFRLWKEQAWDLYDRLVKCGEPLPLHCKGCGMVHESAVKCNRKWCPSCGPRRGNERAGRMAVMFHEIRWPMHVTLTVPNEERGVVRPTVLKELMAGMKRLRRMALWRRNVRGGVLSVEVTDTGNGLHPHIHALIDCEWLALRTPKPHRGDTTETLRLKFRSAAEELTEAWKTAMGDERIRSVKVRRCDSGAIVEVLKYALKSEDVEKCQGEIAPILRVLDSCRNVVSFGCCFGVAMPPTPAYDLGCPCSEPQWRPGLPAAMSAERADVVARANRQLEEAKMWDVRAAFWEHRAETGLKRIAAERAKRCRAVAVDSILR